MEANFKINEEVIKQFTLATQLNNENSDTVVERLLSEYASSSFSNAAKALTQRNENKISVHANNTDFGKAIRKIPTWANKPHQNNHRLIKAFLLVQEEQGKVELEELIIRCTDKYNYPDTFVADFKGNFAQMKTDASNSHGKVFIVEDDEVRIWLEVQPTLDEYADKFRGDGTMTILDIVAHHNDEKNDKTVITPVMTKGAYEVAKNVYSHELTRKEGKLLICKNTNIVAGSAQVYITDFLAMMNGERYTRTLNLSATEYYLQSIKMDFGEESFEKAIAACQQHVNYYNKLGYGKQVKTQELINRLTGK